MVFIALVVHVSTMSSPFLASLWIPDLAGGQIMVIDEASTGNKDLLQEGAWMKVSFRPFPYKQGHENYVKYVSHLVTDFNPVSALRNLPQIDDRNQDVIQVTATIKLNTRITRLHGLPHDHYRFFKCPALGNTYVALERTKEVEGYMRFLANGGMDTEKDVDHEALLQFRRFDLFHGRLFWLIVEIKDVAQQRWQKWALKKSQQRCREEYRFMNLDDIYPVKPPAPVEPEPYLPPRQHFQEQRRLPFATPEASDASLVRRPLPVALEAALGVPAAPVAPLNVVATPQAPSAALLAHLSQCRSKDDLATFVETKKENLESLMIDTANLQSSVQNVRVICLLCTVYGLAICFSPQYGWCVAKEGLIGKSFRAAMEPGNWFSVPLCPAVSGSEDELQVANWIVLPECREASPPFNVFCRNKSSALAIIEAMAYDNLRRVQNDFGSKFLILETSMGQVWMPGSIEKRQGPAEMVEIPCPPRCACGGAYRSYEDPNTEAPVDHRRRDSDTTIDELLASEDSEFQIQGTERSIEDCQSWDDLHRHEAHSSEKLRFDSSERRSSDSLLEDSTLDDGPSFDGALRPRDAVRRPIVFQKSTRREEELQPNSRRSSGGRFANLRVVGRDAHQEEVERPPTDEEVRIWEEALEASDRERMEAQDYEAFSQESQEAIEADRALVPVSSSQDDSCVFCLYFSSASTSAQRRYSQGRPSQRSPGSPRSSVRR
ncbi:hypothetical protein L596_013549 [Steinernema carpocapsae]|uniref:Uncharacterized protein n=1 Tax=Steinernema carpocapsae TaxID=34508 RepID=A0A4U5P0H9_STECR|nr:hypothetical protein L596_013549 [Steinernema carpocapsae]